MELLTLILSGLLALLSPVGLVVDKVAENAIRSQFERVEQLQVRVDNVPNYQLLQGKVDRVQIAGRGLWLTPYLRLAALELESDPVNVDVQRLRQGDRGSPLQSLRQPLQAGVRVVLTQEDINQALQSPIVMGQLRDIATRFLGGLGGEEVQRYEFVSPQVEFLENNRLRLRVALRELPEQGTVETDATSARQLAIRIETGLGITEGRQLQFIQPEVSINETQFPSLFLTPLVENISQELNLANFEERGITARLLKLDVTPNQMEIAAFVRVLPSQSDNP